MGVSYQDGLHLIPEHMHGAIARYVDLGERPGHFLTALLSNDFMGAMGRVDDQSIAASQGWAIFIHCYLPSDCHGSPGRVAEWCGHHGLAGPERKTAETMP